MRRPRSRYQRAWAVSWHRRGARDHLGMDDVDPLLANGHANGGAPRAVHLGRELVLSRFEPPRGLEGRGDAGDLSPVDDEGCLARMAGSDDANVEALGVAGAVRVDREARAGSRVLDARPRVIVRDRFVWMAGPLRTPR